MFDFYCRKTRPWRSAVSFRLAVVVARRYFITVYKNNVFTNRIYNIERFGTYVREYEDARVELLTTDKWEIVRYKFHESAEWKPQRVFYYFTACRFTRSHGVHDWDKRGQNGRNFAAEITDGGGGEEHARQKQSRE